MEYLQEDTFNIFRLLNCKDDNHPVVRLIRGLHSYKLINAKIIKEKMNEVASKAARFNDAEQQAIFQYIANDVKTKEKWFWFNVIKRVTIVYIIKKIWKASVSTPPPIRHSAYDLNDPVLKQKFLDTLVIEGPSDAAGASAASNPHRRSRHSHRLHRTRDGGRGRRECIGSRDGGRGTRTGCIGTRDGGRGRRECRIEPAPAIAALAPTASNPRRRSRRRECDGSRDGGRGTRTGCIGTRDGSRPAMPRRSVHGGERRVHCSQICWPVIL